MGLEAIVIALVKEAMLTSHKLTSTQLTRLVENHPEYGGQSTGRALERQIRTILHDENVLQQLREESKSENNVSLGFKIGRLEIKGKLDLSKH